MKNKIIEKKNILIIITLVLSILSSCMPEKVRYEESNIPPERLIKKMEGNRRKIKTFDGTGKILIDAEKIGEIKGNFSVTIKKPDSISVSIYGPFGIDMAHILVSKNNFQFYEVMKNKLYYGRIGQDILRRIFKIDLSFNELIDAFAGSVNLTEKLAEVPTEYKIDDEKYFLIYKEKGGNKTEYNINVLDLSISNYKVINPNEEIILESFYSKIKRINDVPIPYNAVIINKMRSEKIVIDYRNIKVNKKIESLLLKLPKDVEKIQW